MPLRPCLGGCGRITSGTRCPGCTSQRNRQRDQRRGSSTARGYGAEHQRERDAWAPIVEAGGVRCRRADAGLCVADDPVIDPNEPWHLGHPDEQCKAPKAPEHEICNSGAPRRKDRPTGGVDPGGR